MIKRFERQLTLGGGGKKHIIVIFVNNRGFPESDFSQQILNIFRHSSFKIINRRILQEITKQTN